MRTISSQPSLVTSRKLRLGRLMPALFTRMSTRPWRLWISAAAFATCALSPTSQATASALTCFSACLSVASLRPEITTLAPLFASAVAAARPMPEPPPVTQATLPLSSPAGILLGTEEHLGLLLAEAWRLPPAIRQHFHRLLHRRPLGDAVAPALHLRVIIDVHALAFRRPQPRHGRHVGDRVLVAGEPFARFQLLFQNPVEAVGLVLVAVHGVLDLLRRIAEEVMRLPEHRPDVAHLRHHPLHHLPALAQILGQEFPGLRRQIEEHRAGLRERERLAVGPLLVDHRRDLVVRRDGEEPGLELVPGADIDRMHAVLEPRLLEHDVDLVPVGGGPGIEVDHSFTSCLPKFLPLRRSISPRGAFSRPCTTDSRYLSLPSAKWPPSAFSASP